MINPSHEKPFQYPDALVSSCASSLLARSVRSHGDSEKDGSFQERRDNDISSSSSASSSSSGDCRALFEQHGAHYQRPPLSETDEQFWGAWEEDDGAITDNDQVKISTPISPRIEAFLRSVIFVHQHNKMGKQHEVTLNRFSDMASHELPLMSGALDTDYFDAFQNHKGMDESSEERDPMLVPLDDDETIMEYGGEIRRMQQQQYRSNNNVASHTSKFQSMLRDSWWWVGGGHNHGNQHRHDQVDASTKARNPPPPLSRHSSHTKQSRSKDDSFLLDKENELGGLEEKEDDGESNDDWSHHLNWATEENPDGVPLVHPTMDQGLCGSCWAVSALGTLEASITRNMGYIAYEDAYASVASPRRSNGNKPIDPTKFAVLAAQEIERQSISTADLSVQELVDCDTRYDQGCLGGNPLLAFYFLHRFGITSSKNYPYTGTQNGCKYHKVDQPIATVGSWGILTPDHENNMEKVLRYIGPVAVGLIGADPAFLAYEKGVFTSSKGGKCDLGQADHAMLITGYGEEVSKDGTVVKYWIARNSWGSGWGENGYVRVARSGGKKGHRGVCGIARSPSVALGGMFTKDVELGKEGLYGSTISGEHGHSGSKNTDNSAVARGSSQIQSVLHRIRARLGFLQKGIMMSTMDGNENRDLGNFLPYVTVAGMLAVCLLLTQLYRKRRHNRQPDIERQQSSEEESVATNWSTTGLYNGVPEDNGSSKSYDSKGSNKCNDGERMYLLENNSGYLYTDYTASL